MDNENAALFEAVILDHYESPRHFGRLEEPSHSAVAYNPLCGDQYTVYLRVEKDSIIDVSFEGYGCAVSQASLSMMTDAIRGLDTGQFVALYDRLSKALHPSPTVTVLPATPTHEPPGELSALLAVRNAPTRISCALLGWQAVQQALKQEA